MKFQKILMYIIFVSGLDASPEIPEPVTHEEDEKGARR